MQGKYTPAPWLMNVTNAFIEKYPGVMPITSTDDKLIATVSYQLETVLDTEYVANVNLIAAAPDLLEALTELLEEYCSLAENEWDHPERLPVCQKAAAAIKKATGI